MRARVLPAVAAGLLLSLLLLWWLLPHGIGVLQAKHGQVERDQRAALGDFQPAEIGASFEIGDGLRTGLAGSAEVLLSDGPLLKVRASTLIRFRGSRAGGARVALDHGELSVFSIEDPVLFETAAGLVRLAPHSRAVLREQSGTTWVEVLLGRAELEWAAVKQPLGAGQGARFDHRSRVFQATRAGAPAPAAPAQPSMPQLAHPAGAPDAASSNEQPPHAALRSAANAPAGAQELTPDFIVDAGPSLTLYDPAPPTQLGFERLPCSAGQLALEVEQAGRFVSGAGLVFAFPPGSSRYRLRCGARVLRSGRVRVLADAGQRPLPERPPHNHIEADGLSYTVLYQTRLPELQVHWASAPAQGCTLTVQSGDERRAFPVSGQQVTLPSGTLGEGRHRLWFERPDRDLRSRTTQLEIRFDNATPLAHLSQAPQTTGDEVAVSGAVVTGARVSIRGARVALDAAGRFHTSVPAEPGTRGFAVKVELPQRSVVYYVRRFRASNAPR